jgi:hypothetical protein
MKKLFIAIIALLVLSVAPSFALEADYLPMSYVFPLVGSATAGAEEVSVVTFVAPADITLKGVYVTDTTGVAANASDSATFNLLVAGVAKQTFTTNVTANALVAMTPKAFALVTTANAHRIAKGAVVTASVTKNGSGVAHTSPVIQINYTIGW